MDFTSCSATTSKIWLKTIQARVNEELLKDLERLSTSPLQFRNLQEVIKAMLTQQESWLSDDLPFKVRDHPCLSSLDIEFIGSTSEGLSLSEVSESGVNEEFDITAILQTIEASQFYLQHEGKKCLQIENSNEYPGFVFLKMHIWENSRDWCGLCNILTNSDGSRNEFYLSPVAFTDEFFMMLGLRYSVENMKYVTHCKDINMILGDEDDNLGASEDTVDPVGVSDDTDDPVGFFILNQEGPAIKTTYLTGRESSLQFDCSLAVRCQEWPVVANEFKERKRMSGFPSKELLKKVISLGCLVVPKYPDESKTMLEWRLSFCLIEREVMLSLTDDQRRCYLLFKAIWRQFLCPPIGKALQSYHLKNVFLWECENVPRNDWTDATLVARIMGLLQRLQHNLFTGHCPHYVLPVNNLFKDIDEGVLFYAGMRVQTCIFQSDVVWIENDSLLALPPHRTRLALGRQLRNTCISSLKYVIESMVTGAVKSSVSGNKQSNMVLSNGKTFEKERNNLLGLELEKSFSKGMSKILSQYIQSIATVRSLHCITCDYICSRTSPKQLLVASKEGSLDGIAAVSNTVMNWGNVIEIITKLEILETENFVEYGYPDSFKLLERMKLLFRMGLDSFGKNFPDENSVDENDEDSSVDAGFVCDGCEEEIVGDRYHCKSCEDFDLCVSCYQEIKHPHDFDIVQTGDSEIEELIEEQCKQC